MHTLRALLFVALSVSSCTAWTGELLVINTGFTPPVSTIYERLLQQACERMGITLEFHELPGERALALADQGAADGECCRIPKIVLSEYHNIVAVPEGVFTVNFSAFTKQPDIVIKNWDDLKPYSVGTVTGWKILVQNMQRVEPKQGVVLDTPDSLFQMLDLGRVDVALLGELSGLDMIHKLAIKNINTQNPPLASHTLYLMLNKRHEKLVPKFTATFKAMREDGTTKKIVDKVMKEISP